MSATTVARGRVELRALGPAVAELTERIGAPVTARWEWLWLWAETHPSWQPLTVTVSRGGVTAAALLAARARGPLLEVVALGHGQSDYARLPALTPEDASDLAMAVAAELAAWRRPWRLRLQQLPVADAVLVALAHRLPHARLETGDGAPVVPLGPDVDPVAAMTKSARQSARSGVNRAGSDGRTLLLWSTRDAAEIAGVMAEIERLHRDRDHQVRGGSDLDDTENRAFWRRVHDDAARRGELELTTLRIDGVLAAYLLGFLDGAAYRVWDTRIADGFGRYNPGHVLRAEVLRRLATEPRWECCDWMRGEEPYKLAMTSTVHGAQSLRAWSSPALRRGEDAARDIAARLRGRRPCAS